MSSNLERIQKESVRRLAVAKLGHAFQLGQSLHDDMHLWWREANARTEWVLSEDRRSLEFVIDVPKPPVEHWEMRANDVVQNLRVALDALTRSVASEFVGPGKKSDVAFPTATTEKSWLAWKGHKVLPAEVVERYRSIQPFVTRRIDLDGLRRASNLGKHDFVVTASCQPATLSFEGTATVDGIATDDDAAAVRAELVEPQIRGGRQVIFRITYPREILDHSTAPVDYALSVWLTMPAFVAPAGWTWIVSPSGDFAG